MMKKCNEIKVFLKYCPIAHRYMMIEKNKRKYPLPRVSRKPWAITGNWAIGRIQTGFRNYCPKTWAICGQSMGSVQPEWADISGMGAIILYSTNKNKGKSNEQPTIPSIMQSTPGPYI